MTEGEGAGEPGNGKTGMERALAGALAEKGRITFRDFMEMMLYHPELGYYNREKPVVGRAGDFFTCPSHSPFFGFALAEYVRRAWVEAGRSPEFTVLEMGGGEGHLAESLLERWVATIEAGGDGGTGGPKLRYIIVETSPARRGAQARRLAKVPSPVEWRTLEDLSPFRGVVIANELFDALPVHVVEMSADGLLEIYVTGEPGGGLRETPGPLSTEELGLSLAGISLPQGGRTQAAPAGREIVRALGRCLLRGKILVIDYGAPSPERHLSSRYGLRTFFQQWRTDNPFVRLGKQDITADVDFTALEGWAKEAGFRVTGYQEQGDFLLDLGLEEEMERLQGLARTNPVAGMELGKIVQLVSPFGLGEMFKVLELAK